eukprot:scaffold222913_cov19-Tisochrysis_lutea.AAC.1
MALPICNDTTGWKTPLFLLCSGALIERADFQGQNAGCWRNKACSELLHTCKTRTLSHTNTRSRSMRAIKQQAWAHVRVLPRPPLLLLVPFAAVMLRWARGAGCPPLAAAGALLQARSAGSPLLAAVPGLPRPAAPLPPALCPHH